MDKRSSIFIATLAGLIFMAVAASLTVLMLQQASILHNGEISKQSVDILVDCTTPQGECYKSGNKSQSSAVRSINEVSILAAYCANKPENKTADTIRACIQDEINKEGGK
jgi:hypothetical protein